MILNNKQKQYLKGLAHSLKPVVLLGQHGLTEGVLAEIDLALNHHELIKVKVLENSEYDPREAADILCEALDCDCVQVIGRKFVLFKQKKKESAYAALLAK